VTNVDYLVVGSGLTGGTIARVLTDYHREVLVLERRAHLGGNVFDTLHSSNVRIHTYGPHYFRCSSPRVWQFLHRFSGFYPYEARVLSRLNGHYESWPPNRDLLERFAGWEPPPTQGPPQNFEAACLQKMPRSVYELLVRGYTARQWGRDPALLSPGLAERVRINGDGQTTLTPDRIHQALPDRGYAALVGNLLANIPCLLGIDFLQHSKEYHARKALIFTGSLDEFFGFDGGRLEYRSQKRIHEFHQACAFRQPCAQVNYPAAGDNDPLRTLEWKHLLPTPEQCRVEGTVITSEYPFTPTEPDQFEYPVPTIPNRLLYRQYRARARALPKLVVCGRLGSYRYLDMDQAIRRALAIGEALVNKGARPRARSIRSTAARGWPEAILGSVGAEGASTPGPDSEYARGRSVKTVC
jgi:UDP-galactopyranose mutase